jgi:hypothetical protein
MAADRTLDAAQFSAKCYFCSPSSFRCSGFKRLLYLQTSTKKSSEHLFKYTTWVPAHIRSGVRLYPASQLRYAVRATHGGLYISSKFHNYKLHRKCPIVANIGATIHFKNDIVIEYTLPDNVKALWLSQQCYAAINDTNSTCGFGPALQSGVCRCLRNERYPYREVQQLIQKNKIDNESTGTLLWNLGHSTGEGYNYCFFALYNWTISSCSWGPFGLTGWEVSATNQGPLLVSELFKISPPSSEGPSLIELGKTTTQSPAPVTATPGNVTCPPSGIPAAPISMRLQKWR